MKEGPSTETVYLREKLHGLKDIFKYFPAPRDDSYLMRRQKGELEGLAESIDRQRPAQNISRGIRSAPGTYDIASKLRLYHPSTSSSYTPKRNPYEKIENKYYI